MKSVVLPKHSVLNRLITLIKNFISILLLAAEKEKALCTEGQARPIGAGLTLLVKKQFKKVKKTNEKQNKFVVEIFEGSKLVNVIYHMSHESFKWNQSAFDDLEERMPSKLFCLKNTWNMIMGDFKARHAQKH